MDGYDQIKTDRREIRKVILAKRDSLSAAEREKGNVLVTEKLLGHQWYYSATQILCFASYGSEISTDCLIRESLRSGKKVFLPRVEGKDLSFYSVKDPDRLVPGFHGIPEPSAEGEIFRPDEDLAHKTLMIMPGAVFDLYRNRLGYGGGFYDRYLADKPWMRTIAIGYRCQQVDQLPALEWDVKPGQIILG